MSEKNLLLYTNDNGAVKIDVLLKDETNWLTINQMVELFGIDKSGVSKVTMQLKEGIRVWQNVQAIGSSKMGSTIIKPIQYDKHRVSWLQTATIKFSS